MNLKMENQESFLTSDEKNLLKKEMILNIRYLLDRNKFTPNTKIILENIYRILIKCPTLCNEIVKKESFINQSMLVCLLSPSTSIFKNTINLLIHIIKTTKVVPKCYITRDFVFFLSEKLFQYTLRHNNITLVENKYVETEEDIEEKGICKNGKKIIEFVTTMIMYDQSIVPVLNSVGFFKLVSGIICYETVKLYNTIFQDKYFMINDKTEGWMSEIDRQKKENLVAESIYEIHRVYFEPEVIFKEKEIFRYKKVSDEYQNGVYCELHDMLRSTSLYSLLNLSSMDFINVINYKRCGIVIELSYNEMMKELAEKHAEELNGRNKAKNREKYIITPIIRYYRRQLEFGKYPKEIHFYKFLLTELETAKGPEVIRDIVIVMFYYCDELRDCFIGEKLIFKIFRALEYNCDVECSRFRDSSAHLDVSSCARIRISGLIQAIYDKSNRSFYKPSFLILLRSVQAHVPELSDFINIFYRNFIDFIMSNKKNLSSLFIDIESRFNDIKTRKVRYSSKTADDRPEIFN